MLYDISKVIVEKLEKANYSDSGIATISLEEYRDVEEVKKAILEVEKLNDYKDAKLDLNEGTMMLSVYNPSEDISGFNARHPNSQSCGGR
ncbi:MAG: hypothetical protein RR614_00930 [Eubacterium sp.]